MASSRVRSQSKEIVYPESDGKPLGETGWHVTATIEFLSDLKFFYARRRDVYVASNMFLYYSEGDPSKVVCPDCMVIFGVDGNHERRTFKTWIERAVPAFVLEVSSKKTIRNDLGKKKAIYADLGVLEYVLHDPEGDCLKTPLIGFRLDAHGVYQPIPLDLGRTLLSETLEYYIVPEDKKLRLIDARTRVPLPFMEEYPGLLEDANRVAEATFPIADRERQNAANARQLADRERQNAANARQLADRERQNAANALERADRERQNAAELAGEVERLKKLLAERHNESNDRS